MLASVWVLWTQNAGRNHNFHQLKERRKSNKFGAKLSKNDEKPAFFSENKKKDPFWWNKTFDQQFGASIKNQFFLLNFAP